MFLQKQVMKKMTLLSIGAISAALCLSGASNVSAQAFTPADPEPILSGSTGFIDLAAFQTEGREGAPGKTATSGTFVFNGSKFEFVPFNDESNFNQTTKGNIGFNNGLYTNNGAGGEIVSIDFESLTVSAEGGIDGIAVVNGPNGSQEMDINGYALFIELTTRDYEGANGSGLADGDKGFISNTYPQIQDDASLVRNLYHEVVISGGNQATGYGFYLYASSRAYDESNGVVFSYDDNFSDETESDKVGLLQEVNAVQGFLATIDGYGRQVGISNIRVTGLLDSRGTFDTTIRNLTAIPNTNFRVWTGENTLTRTSPQFGPISSPLNRPGFSFFSFEPHNTQVNYPGFYYLYQTNENQRPSTSFATTRTESYGFLLSTQAELNQVASGVRTLDDLEYRDLQFYFSTPSAFTLVRSGYPDPFPVLQRTDLGVE